MMLMYVFQSETLDKVRRWSDGWKRRARLMAVPRPDIETTRSGSDQAQRASALSALLTANAVDRRPDWFNLREHVESQHHNYLEEDTSDDEPMEHDDEIYLDGVCHTGCEVCYMLQPLSKSDSSFYSLFSSHFLLQWTRPLRPSCPIALALPCRSKRKPRLRVAQGWSTTNTVEYHY